MLNVFFRQALYWRFELHKNLEPISLFHDTSYKLKLLDILKNASKDKKNAWLTARQLIANEKINDFTDVYKFLFDNVDEYAPGKSANIVIMLDQQTYHDSLVVDKEITFASTIAQIVQTL